jgi:hypothetical protein
VSDIRRVRDEEGREVGVRPGRTEGDGAALVLVGVVRTPDVEDVDDDGLRGVLLVLVVADSNNGAAEAASVTGAGMCVAGTGSRETVVAIIEGLSVGEVEAVGVVVDDGARGGSGATEDDVGPRWTGGF